MEWPDILLYIGNTILIQARNLAVTIKNIHQNIAEYYGYCNGEGEGLDTLN